MMWRYIIAVVLLAHGIGHIMLFMTAWTPQVSKVGFSDASWIFSGGVGVGSPIGQAFALLGLVALIGFVANALGLVAHDNDRGSSHLHRDHCNVDQCLITIGLVLVKPPLWVDGLATVGVLVGL